MSIERFGDVEIFRPSQEMENLIGEKAKIHLLSRFAPAEYRGSKAANAVIQHQFKFYEGLLRPIISKLTSRGAAEFLLFQFDEAGRLLHGNGILDLSERERWKHIQPLFRRAIKYLVELICLRASNSEPKLSQSEALFAMESALICVESMIHFAMASDEVHSIYPDNCIVKIFDNSPVDFITIKADGAYADYNKILLDRIVRDRESRDRFVESPQFDNHTATHQKYLDEAFRQSFGLSYGEFIEAIRAVIEGCQPSLHPNSFPTLFVHRDKVIDQLAKSNRSRAAIERAIDGFSLTAVNLTAEKRVVWNPKQESRAYRRGFFVFPHETGPHLAFSREMAKESLTQLVCWVCFKHLPTEWRTQETLKALDNLSSAASEWFEIIVCRHFQSLGITGQRMHRTIGSASGQIKIPTAVGEIDFLGYHPQQKLLVLAEAKMTMTGLEARYWRDDLDEFVFRKMLWVEENRNAISSALGFGDVEAVGTVMLTLYPCIARMLIPDFPCVSITEFMLDYERQSKWPYPVKIF